MTDEKPDVPDLRSLLREASPPEASVTIPLYQAGSTESRVREARQTAGQRRIQIEEARRHGDQPRFGVRHVAHRRPRHLLGGVPIALASGFASARFPIFPRCPKLGGQGASHREAAVGVPGGVGRVHAET